MKNILYFGTFVDEVEFNKIIKLDKNPQSATQLFSLKLLNSLIIYKEFNFTILTTNVISEYPSNTRIINKSKNWKYKSQKIKELFFINIPVLKTITLIFSLSLNSLNWFFSIPKSNKKCVFIDNYQLPYLLIGFLFSKLSNIPLVGVLTDPPNMTYKLNNEPILKKAFRGINAKLSKYLLNKLNGVIALTDYLAEDFCPASKYIVVEAIGEGNNNDKMVSKNDKFIVMYSGGLSLKYGIKILLDSFSDLKLDNIELWFFGKGDALNLILDYEKNDDRIKYKGYLENEHIKKIQTQVSILINPRPIDLPDGKYSFPSKILEYMESGTPSLVTKLKGIPKEYDDHLIYIDPLNKDEIISKIEELYFMDKQQLLILGKNAKEFARKKNVISQGEKIYQFLNSISVNHK